LQILAIASAIAAVCASHPIPIRSASLPLRLYRGSFKRIFSQAWPVLVSQWASMTFAIMDTAMTGHASAADLAAMGLAVSVYITVFVGLMGVLHALIPILAQHFGAGRLRDVGAMWGQGIWLSLMLSAFGATAMLFPDAWLSLSGELDASVRTKVNGYLQALALALPAALAFRTIYALANAVSRPKIVMMINLGAIGIKFACNSVLIYGLAGIPALGAAGAGLSTAISSWVMLAAGVWVLQHDPFFRRLHLRVERPRWTALKELLRLGLPMGGSYLVEVCAFTFMALIVAREGTLVIGGQQIVSNLTALSFMMPMSLGVAGAALTAQAIGAGDYALARRTGQATVALGVLGALSTATVLYLGRVPIASAYTSDSGVAAMAIALLPIIPVFHFCDAMQCMVSYLLRAYKVAFVPLLLQTVSLGLVGLLGGWWLGFGAGRDWWPGLRAAVLPAQAPTGAAAMWAMSGVGLALSCALLWCWYLRILRRYAAGAVDGSIRKK